MEIDKLLQRQERKTKTATILASMSWLVLQVCGGHRDIAYVVLTTLLAVFPCHICSRYINKHINELTVCMPCQDIDYRNIDRHSFVSIESNMDFLSCNDCVENHSVGICFLCDYTACGDEVEEPMVFTCRSNEPEVEECTKCHRQMCYSCRVKHCMTYEPWAYIPSDFVFLCHECRVT